MVLRRWHVMVLAVCGATLASAIPAQAAGTGASVPGWHVVMTISHPKYNSLETLAAISPKDAWMGGCAQKAPSRPGPSPIPTWPIAGHFAGHRWSLAKLPAGLHGCISVISASSAWNVWAFGYDATGSYALALRHGRWSVAARWPSAGDYIVGAAVLSAANVWAFSYLGRVEHFDGSAWHRTSIPGLSAPPNLNSVSVDSRGGVWVLAGASTGSASVARLRHTASGYTWQVTSVVSQFPVDSGYPSIYAPTPSDAWLIGGGQRQVHGRAVYFPVLAHWADGAWHAVQARGDFPLRTAVADGHGGLWVTTDWDSTGIPPHLLHYTGGRFVSVALARHGARYAGVYGLADIKGTTSVWGAGTLSGLGSLGSPAGVVLKFGR